MMALDRSVGRRIRWLVFVGIAAIVFVLSFSRGMTRSFNHDEHQFVTPAVLLTQDGLLPYRDYPYFHMPNQVYLYAALTWWTPYKLLVARIIQVLCGTAIAVLLFATAWRLLGRMDLLGRRLIAGGLLLVPYSSRLFRYTDGLAWNHETSTPAHWPRSCCICGAQRAAPSPPALSGSLLGCAIGIRLSFAPAAVPFLLSFWLTRSPVRRGQRLGGPPALRLAMTVGPMPPIVPWRRDPPSSSSEPGLSAAQRLLAHVTLPKKILILPRKLIDQPATRRC